MAEAYEVLSDQMKKAFYDEWGEEKLKQGIFVNEGLLLEQHRKEEEAAALEI